MDPAHDTNLLIKICDECRSEFYAASSPMESLCPECAHILYGYENCKHEFIGDRCTQCFWNGNSGEYVARIKAENGRLTEER